MQAQETEMHAIEYAGGWLFITEKETGRDFPVRLLNTLLKSLPPHDAPPDPPPRPARLDPRRRRRGGACGVHLWRFDFRACGIA
jgi:hypothetical protein